MKMHYIEAGNFSGPNVSLNAFFLPSDQLDLKQWRNINSRNCLHIKFNYNKTTWTSMEQVWKIWEWWLIGNSFPKNTEQREKIIIIIIIRREFGSSSLHNSFKWFHFAVAISTKQHYALTRFFILNTRQKFK